MVAISRAEEAVLWGCGTCCTAPTSDGSPPASRPAASRATSASCSTATGAGRGPTAPTPSRATRPAPTTSPLLGWCEEVGVEVVTLWLLSTDNLNRPAAELTPLLSIIEAVVTDLAAERPLAAQPGRRAGPAAGRRPRTGSRSAADLTRGRRRDDRQRRGRLRRPPRDRRRGPLPAAGAGRQRAPRSRSSPRCSTSSTSPSTSTPRASPTPTWSSAPPASSAWAGSCSGRARTASSTSARRYWPDFRHVDFLRALRAYAERERRFGA